MSFNLAHGCTYNVQFSTFDWEVRRLGMRECVKSWNYNGIRIWIYSQKLPFSVGKKCFKDKFRKHNTPIRHITNISDFVWFQRSCGSMKSVSSFSSIDFPHMIMLRNQKVQFCLKEFMAFFITWCTYLWLLYLASGSSQVCWRHNRSYLHSSIQGFSHYPVYSSGTRKLYHNITEK